MKCYLALTAPADENDIYVNLLEVALKSARLYTTLDLYVLYDGPSNHRCCKILYKYGVNIINHRFSHYKYMEKVYPKEWMNNTLKKSIDYDKIAGTFMRLDIPFIETEEEFVLYVDIDVIFMKDIQLDELPRPEYLAAAPEFLKDISKMEYFNAGILLLNVPNMRKKCQQIFDMMERGERNQSGLFDQGFLNQVCFADMELLPLEYNWKPYWGINDSARIIHMHGMKPGGTVVNSGFGMSDEALCYTLYGHPEDINGYIYYIMIYYELLGADGKRWISDFISKNVLLIQSDKKHVYCEQEVKKYYNLYIKYMKKTKKYKTLTMAIFLLFIIFIGVFVYVSI